MNQTEIRKEPRDCFAVLQLFPEPYRQKVRMALRAPEAGVCRTGNPSVSAARHTAASAAPVACGNPLPHRTSGFVLHRRRGMVRNGGRQFAKDTAAYAAVDRQPKGALADHSAHLPVFHVCV